MPKNAVETLLSDTADAGEKLLAEAGPQTQQELSELVRNGQAPYVERVVNAVPGLMLLIRYSGK
jgi:hypothetical protein